MGHLTGDTGKSI